MSYINHEGSIDVQLLLDILEDSEYYNDKEFLRSDIYQDRELLESYISYGEDPAEILNREIEGARDQLLFILTDEVYGQIQLSKYDEGTSTYNDIYYWLDAGDFEGLSFEDLMVMYIDMLEQAEQEVE